MTLVDADLEPLPFCPHDDSDGAAFAGLSDHIARLDTSRGEFLREGAAADSKNSRAPRARPEHVDAQPSPRAEVRCAPEEEDLFASKHAQLFPESDFEVWRDYRDHSHHQSTSTHVNDDSASGPSVREICEELFEEEIGSSQAAPHLDCEPNPHRVAENVPAHTPCAASSSDASGSCAESEWAPSSPDSFRSFETESQASPPQPRSRSGSSAADPDFDCGVEADADEMLLQDLELLALAMNPMAALVPAPVQRLAPSAVALGAYRFFGGPLEGLGSDASMFQQYDSQRAPDRRGGAQQQQQQQQPRASSGLLSLAATSEEQRRRELQAENDALLQRARELAISSFSAQQQQPHAGHLRFGSLPTPHFQPPTLHCSSSAHSFGAATDFARATDPGSAGRKRQRDMAVRAALASRSPAVRSGEAAASSSSSSSAHEACAHASPEPLLAGPTDVSNSTMEEIWVMHQLMGLIARNLEANPRGERNFEGLKRRLLSLPQLRDGVRRTLNGSFKQKVKNLVQERRKRAQLDNWKVLKAAPDLRAELRFRLMDQFKYDDGFIHALASYLEQLFAEDKQAPGNLLDWPEQVRQVVIDKCVFLHANFYGNRVFRIYEDLGFLFAVGELQLAVLAGCGCAECTSAWRLEAVDRTCLHALKLHWTRETAALLESLLAKHVELGAEMLDYVRDTEPKLRGWDRKEINVLLKSLHTSTQCSICKSGKRARHRSDRGCEAATEADAEADAEEDETYMAELALENEQEWDFMRAYELE